MTRLLDSIFIFVKRFQLFFFWTFSSSLIAITIISRLLLNGDVFDFDYHLYQPDGAIYTYESLRWLGYDHTSAALQVIKWYEIHAEDESNLSIGFFDPSNNPGVWSLTKYRVLYSLLSVPFVYFFGIPGMLAIPIMSIITLFVVVTFVSVKQNNLLMGVVVITCLSLSPTIMRWHIANITDGLLASLFSLLLLFHFDKVRQKSTIVLTLLIVLTSATRFCAPYWYAFALFLFLKTSKKLAGLTFLISTISVLPTLLARPDPGSIVSGVEGGFLQKAIYLPVSAVRVLFVEVAQLAAMDRALLLILSVALIVALTRPRSAPSLLLFLFILAGWFIGALNGVLGVNFRYQLPIIPVACLSILNLIQTQTYRFPRNVVEVKIRKRNEKLRSGNHEKKEDN